MRLIEVLEDHTDVTSPFTKDFLDEFFFIVGDEFGKECDEFLCVFVGHESGEFGFNIAKILI